MGLFKDCGCGCGGSEQKKKFTASLMSAFLFFIIANPETFIIVRRILGNWVASASGFPTMFGLILHSFVFMLLVWGIMNLKREKADGDDAPKMGEPPAAIPEGEAKKDGMLPPAPEMEQPMSDLGQSAAAAPPPPTVTKGTMSKVSNMLGGHDINADMGSLAPAPPVYGGNWRQCSCGDGTQVMILK